MPIILEHALKELTKPDADLLTRTSPRALRQCQFDSYSRRCPITALSHAAESEDLQQLWSGARWMAWQ